MTDQIECPVEGCGFAVEPDETAREVLEQHVRWLHLQPGEFGENPMPALTFMFVNGLIRPDEFSAQVTRVANTAFAPPKTRGPGRLTRGLWVSFYGALVGVAISTVWFGGDVFERVAATATLLLGFLSYVLFLGVVGEVLGDEPPSDRPGILIRLIRVVSRAILRRKSE